MLVIKSDQILHNVTQKVASAIFHLRIDVFQKAIKVTKSFGYFLMNYCSQNLQNIANYGHTGLTVIIILATLRSASGRWKYFVIYFEPAVGQSFEHFTIVNYKPSIVVLTKYFKWAIAGLFFIHFRLLKKTLQFLQQINVKNVHPV